MIIAISVILPVEAFPPVVSISTIAYMLSLFRKGKDNFLYRGIYINRAVILRT
jgi:hypothetical protein